MIPIEERDPAEVTGVRGWTANGHRVGVTITPPGVEVRNWGFDVTPARLVSGFITERGIIPAAPYAIAQALAAGNGQVSRGR